ncbi:hypothetical protein Q4601_09005 [Shewanella sp. 1_MG-2023]|uniref:hypothetical protein n=1 Tax=unclassified Shewanella TaxID=196818 RepID=UPI0026E42CF8|nr:MULTISPECIES: hypothetical protein [unclassified Shewanella]MDO6610431.1 hypothetical protein [Shewanella sp. 7_MG-2023]MDO6770556.1 hypothetical protein [Shewanella sp. 2_MG-2023]MDO6794443.1 hypothetical protein [Shewanella sp. 1_MG-2023]
MKWINILLISFLLFGCEQVATIEPEVRPNNIPLAALWVGGSDGGVYVKVDPENGQYKGTIYFESSGEVWYQGGFQYSGNEIIDTRDQTLYAAWDGDILYLTNGEKLVSMATE